jgi:hypothetical protein
MINLPEGFKNKIVLDTNIVDLPIDVYSEIAYDLWSDKELGNDVCYYTFKVDSEYCIKYSLLNNYLKNLGIKECLIHHSW